MKFKESDKIEFKKSTAELNQSLIDLCAFANYGIGTVYFGISDDGNIIGQKISDDTIKRVSTTILSSIEPRIYPNVYIDSIKGKNILVVEIKNSPEKPYFYKGKAYKRIGTSNAYLSRYEVEKYLYERENPAYRFDKTINNEYNNAIDAKTVKWFLEKAKEERNLPVDTKENNKVTLSKLGLLSQSKLNFAGIMTFGKEIQKYFTDTIIKCAFFEGVDKTGKIIDHIEIKDNVFIQIDLSLKFIVRNIRKFAQINSQTGRREEQYELPILAIREAVANAVAHRDYRIPSHIDIMIFDDRIEIWSPGGLPLNIKISDLLKKHISVLRNPTIAEILFLSGYIERWGSGIEKMNQLMQTFKLPIPIYKEIAGNFVVIFKRKKVGVSEQVSEQVISILKFCYIPRSKSEILKYLNLADVYLNYKRKIFPLIEKGILKMTIPEKPRSSKQKYIITEKGKQIKRVGDGG
ncbi:putative DNA binding domain-containing protein [candidate division WOR-3 bacterium]|nr:putative DNA binding domain-containing protein [candidate division WOR-3 bacterium]